jgi:hypothetical protein
VSVIVMSGVGVGRGHGDVARVFVDGCCFCGRLVLGCSEVGLGFMEAHCEGCDQGSCFLLFCKR